jgi:hypothetical protein
MSRRLRAGALLVAAVGMLALGGCRGGAVAAPGPAAPVVSAGSAAGASAGSAGAAADPLGSVEATLDQIEKQVDQDGTG